MIPDKAVEAGTFALFRQNARLKHQRDGHAMPHDDMLRTMWEVVGADSDVTQGWRDDATAVLEAASPFIQAEALREAALDVDRGYSDAYHHGKGDLHRWKKLHEASYWLRDRADDLDPS